MRHIALIVLFASTAPAAASADQVCVENGSDTRWLFVADADDGAREVAELAPGETLCSSGDTKGTVAVFASFDDFEGCSRRIPPGTTERLLAFPHVDLCTWERVE